MPKFKDNCATHNNAMLIYLRNSMSNTWYIHVCISHKSTITVIIVTRQSWIAYPPPRLWTSSHGEQHQAIREAIPLFFFLYKLFKMYFFCEIEKVSRCWKCNVLLLKLKTKSHKTTKRKHVIILITIEGWPEKLKL